jgi:hypothetical protein
MRLYVAIKAGLPELLDQGQTSKAAAAVARGVLRGAAGGRSTVFLTVGLLLGALGSLVSLDGISVLGPP